MSLETCRPANSSGTSPLVRSPLVHVILASRMSGNISAPGRIVLVVTDLMFESRLAAAARALGYDIAAADTAEQARDALRSGPATLLVLDLQADGVSWQEVVTMAKEAAIPILAYGQHTKAELLRAARKAGCEVVVPRSVLVAELPQLIERARGWSRA